MQGSFSHALGHYLNNTKSSEGYINQVHLRYSMTECNICTLGDGSPFLCGDCQWQLFMQFCATFKQNHGVEFKAREMPPVKA